MCYSLATLPMLSGNLLSMTNPTEYKAPAESQYELDGITDEEISDWVRELRTVRRTRNIAIPRFVKALNASGYSIDVNEYKLFENAPRARGRIHVSSYILQHAEKALDKRRVIDSPQSEETAAAMFALMRARTDRNYSYEYVAEELTKRGIPVSAAQYRTAEQGIMRTVPFDLVSGACEILGIRLGEWK